MKTTKKWQHSSLNMRIAAVDYGLNIGIAIAAIEETKLYRVYLETLYNQPEETIDMINSENCWAVILEKAPCAPTGVGAVSYSQLLAGIQTLGYGIVKTVRENGLVLVPPSQWKPFVSKQKPNLSAWHPKTKHEKDAMGMLWYVLRIYKKENIEYV